MPTRKFSFMDVVNQWMITFALFAFCSLVFWQVLPTLVDFKKELKGLQEIERSVKNAATKEQVDSLSDEVRTLQNAIRKEMKDPESWPQLNHQMKLLSPLR